MKNLHDFFLHSETEYVDNLSKKVQKDPRICGWRLPRRQPPFLAFWVQKFHSRNRTPSGLFDAEGFFR